MIPATQSRIGERGTCFRACLASLLNLREDQVPDFPDANQDSGVDKFLRRFGLHYNERPIDRGDPPRGWHVILGESPRGGEHAVVGYNGIFRHDPHPIWDDRRRGLVDEKAWGELLPLKREAKDSKKEAEALRARHDEIVSSHLRGVGNSAETAYRSLHQPMIGLLHDAEALLAKTRLDDDQAYWRDKISDAKRHLAESERCASIRNWSLATSYLDAALTMAHTVIDKLRNTGGRRRARDMVSEKTGLRNTYTCITIDGNARQANSIAEAKYGYANIAVPPQESLVRKATDSDRRARLHRALDYALDRVSGRDALDDKQFLDLMEKVGTLRSSTQSLQWPGNDNPRLQKASTDIYNATMSKVKQLIASSGMSPQEFRKRATKVASKVGRRINLNWIDSLDRH